MSRLQQRLLLLLLLTTTFPPSWAERKRRVIKGNVVKDIGQYPWNARLKSVACSASIIDRFLVLTAAHCVCGQKPSSLTVTVGSSFADGKRPIEVPAADSYFHPYFENCTLTDNYDMAIIRTAKPIPFGRNVNKIAICPSRCYHNGVKGLFLGYGDTNKGNGHSGVLRWGVGEVYTCDHRFCIRYNRKDRSGRLSRGPEITHGDSGGPLVITCPDAKGNRIMCQLAINTSGDLKRYMYFVQVYSLQQFPSLRPYIHAPIHGGKGDDDDDDGDDDRR